MRGVYIQLVRLSSTYRGIHFTSRNALFPALFVYLSVCQSVTYLTYLSFTQYYWNTI